MKVYHVTSTETAGSIKAGGFVDATGTYLTANEYSGVWVSDSPLDVNDMGTQHECCFEIDVDEEDLAPYEWVEDMEGYREWLVPARILNMRLRRLLTTEEVDQVVAQ